jgi:WD40 repeat protein
LLLSFPGHKFRVDGVALSPDGKLLAAGGGNSLGGDLRLWDTASGKEVAVLEGHHGTPFAIAFSPDGKLLAAAGYNAVAVWKVDAVKPIVSIKTWPEFQQLAFSPDGQTLAAASDRDVKLWEVSSGRERRSFRRLVSAFKAQQFSADLKTLVARNYQEIEIWDVDKGKERGLLSEHRGSVGCLAFSDDGKTLVAASHWSTDEVGQYSGEVKLWDLATGRERATLAARVSMVYSLALAEDGKTLALLDLHNIRRGVVLRVFDLPSGRERLTRKGKDRSFQSVTFRAGKLFVLGAEDTTARLWQAELPAE